MRIILLFFAFLTCFIFKIQAQTVTDIDGNVYNTVTIGTQIWMKENLNVTHYRNGTAIPNVLPAWSSLTTGAYCNYNNDTNLSLIYGKLYNWYAVADSQNICPTDWHVASDAEWNILEKYLDNTVDTTAIGLVGTTIGNQLKEAGTIHWNTGNMGTNSSNFTALPGGYRPNGTSITANITLLGGWWTSTSYNVTQAQFRYLASASTQINRGLDGKKLGYSVRCTKDLATQILDQDSEIEFQIYPNPSNGQFIILSSNPNSEISVTNLIGQQILTVKINTTTTNLQISKTGVYLVYLKSQNGIAVKKLIVNF